MCVGACVCIFIFLHPHAPAFCHSNVWKPSLIFNFSKTGPPAASCCCSRLFPQPLSCMCLPPLSSSSGLERSLPGPQDPTQTPYGVGQVQVKLCEAQQEGRAGKPPSSSLQMWR